MILSFFSYFNYFFNYISLINFFSSIMKFPHFRQERNVNYRRRLSIGEMKLWLSYSFYFKEYKSSFWKEAPNAFFFLIPKWVSKKQKLLRKGRNKDLGIRLRFLRVQCRAFSTLLLSILMVDSSSLSFSNEF